MDLIKLAWLDTTELPHNEFDLYMQLTELRTNITKNLFINQENQRKWGSCDLFSRLKGCGGDYKGGVGDSKG